MNTQYSLVPGSLGALAQASGKSIAETFINADVCIIVDTSGSMGDDDSRGGKMRYEVACEELASLQASLPGKIAVINFSSTVQFEPGGTPKFLQGGTNLAEALRFVKVADIEGMKFILISDGEPNDEGKALAVARTFKNKISTIYVGPEERPAGREFLRKLAAVTGGESITSDRAKELATGIRHLLGTGNAV